MSEVARRSPVHPFRGPVLAATSLVLALIAFGCQKPQNDAAGGANAATLSGPELVSRGQYLVTALGCNDCHTPRQMTPNGPEPDMTRMLSGHPEAVKLTPPPKFEAPWMWAGVATNTAFAGPWGITYAANVTPDQNTGLGVWTEEMFINAMRQGKHMGTSRSIQPPMPWMWYGKLTDDDLKSVFAYLRNITPITNHVPDWEPPGGAGY